MAMTVVGIFDTSDHAHAAVAQLTAAGFDRDQISVIRGQPAGHARSDRFDADAAAARTGVTPDWGMASAGAADSAATESALDAETDDLGGDDLTGGVKLGASTGAMAGAGTGAVVGGGLGLLAGAAGLFIPGLGPVLGMGPMLATILGGAGVGAIAGGLSGALINEGVPESDAANFAEGVRRGSTLVTVVAHDEDAGERAADLLDQAGAFDVNERAATWAEATGPVGGNRTVPSLSTLPESSMTADVPVDPD